MARRILTSLFKTLSCYPLFLPPDVYERHKSIAAQISPGQTVLDVGGSLTKLPVFQPQAKITTADVKTPADIIYKGGKIPVASRSFDIVTAIDVLEHIPSEKRQAFCDELTRIARIKVILSAPFGTKLHRDYERRILETYRSAGKSIPYLEEHVAFGLPTLEQIKILSQKSSSEIYFSGNLYLTELLFRLHNFELKNNYLNQLLFLKKLIVNLLVNIVIYPFLFTTTPKETTNRFYLITKSPKV